MPRTRPSWSTEPQPTDHTGPSSARSARRDEPATIVVREEHVVVFGQEANRRRRARIGARRVGEVEELATAVVAECDELGPQPFDHLAQAGQSAPRRHVGDRRRPERGEVAQHHVFERRVGARAAARATPPPSSTAPARASPRGRAAAPVRARAASGRRRRALPGRAPESVPRGTLAVRCPFAAPRARSDRPRRPDPGRRRAAAARGRGGARAAPRRRAGSAGGAAGSRPR